MEEVDSDKLINPDPLAPCSGSLRKDLIVRTFISLGGACLTWHEYSNIAGVVTFLCLFWFFPKVVSSDLTLASGRKIADCIPKVSKLLHGDSIGEKRLEVTYTSSSKQIGTYEMLDEFSEMVSATLASCDIRKLRHAEIKVELPNKRTFFGWNLFQSIAYSKEYEKAGDYWVEVDIP